MTESLIRPELFARTPRNLVIALGVATTVGVLLGRALDNAPRVEHISVPAPHVTVEAPQLPAPVVNVSVPMPTPVAEPEPVVPTPAPEPRSLKPMLLAQCVGAFDSSDACGWDDGFPAISNDGSVIATKFSMDDGGRGYPNLEVHLRDANTGKLTRTIQLLSVDEWVEDLESAPAVALRKKIEARVASAQKLLDASNYRAMKFLGRRDEMLDENSKTVHPTSGIYADLDNGLARLVEPVTNTVIWQHDFTVARATPPDDDEMCGGWNQIGMSLWWDETSRVVLSAQTIRTGGCMCSDDTVETVARIR